jgi:hypothetical protein
MKRIKVSLDAWIQLLGMLSVLAGLVFVGLEMQQTQSIAIAGQQQGRAEITNNFLNSFLENGLDFQTVYFQQEPNHSLSVDEIAFRNSMHIAWFLYENDFYQYTQELMDESTWQAKLAGIQIIYDFCEAREIYDRRAPVFAKEFRSIVESLPNKCAD